MVRIIFTGGSGKAGRHAIPYLLSKGHQVLNVDLIPFPTNDPNVPKVDVFTLKCDLTDSGQVFNAFTSYFGFADYDAFPAPGPPVPDVIVHFAAYARNLLVPDNETFRANATSTYNVIEAACKLGIKKVIIASSETTYGVCFSSGPTDYDYFPLDEEYDTNPMDTYALTKLIGERTARTFSRRFPGTDIYVFRIGNVIEPHEYKLNFPKFLRDPPSRKKNAWSCVDARELGNLVECAIKTSGLGYQVFNATNSTITALVPTAEFLKSVQPQTPHKRSMEPWEAPLTNLKARELLGFKDEVDWKKEVGEETLNEIAKELGLSENWASAGGSGVSRKDSLLKKLPRPPIVQQGGDRFI